MTRSPQFVDHFENPRNVGELGAPAVTVEVSNPVCGDILRLSAERDSQGRITRAAYKARGCSACIACGSALTELLLAQGGPADPLRITAAQVEAAIGGLIPESKHAAVLCADAALALGRAFAAAPLPIH